MDKVVVIGANSFQNPLILKAKERGYETHVFAWQDGSIGEKTADYFYPISIIDKDAILEKCREINPIAVCSIGSDLAMITVSYVAEALGLPTNSVSCIEKSTNKYNMRSAFKKAGIDTPSFARVNNDNFREQIMGMELPVIVKPTDRSGSRSITKIEGTGILNAETDEAIWLQIKSAVASAVNDSFEDAGIIEEYIEGNEYSFEGVSQNGVHNMLQITKKYTTGAPHFIETGHVEPSGIPSDIVDSITEMMFKAFDALDITTGASHGEFKLTPAGKAKIIEIGPRMGGDCIGSDLVEISTGIDYVGMTLDAAIGNELSFEHTRKPMVATVRFIMNKQDLDNFNAIRDNLEPYLVRVCDDGFHNMEAHQVVDSGSRYGYYICALNDDTYIGDIFNEG